MTSSTRTEIMNCVADEQSKRMIGGREMVSIFEDDKTWFDCWNLSDIEIIEVIASIED
jgi:hypothetical protein